MLILRSMPCGGAFQIRFSLRAGAGQMVERAPWKIEWGGGSSVENPHFQRVHYCDLLVSSPARQAVSTQACGAALFGSTNEKALGGKATTC